MVRKCSGGSKRSFAFPPRLNKIFILFNFPRPPFGGPWEIRLAVPRALAWGRTAPPPPRGDPLGFNKTTILFNLGLVGLGVGGGGAAGLVRGFVLGVAPGVGWAVRRVRASGFCPTAPPCAAPPCGGLANTGGRPSAHMQTPHLLSRALYRTEILPTIVPQDRAVCQIRGQIHRGICGGGGRQPLHKYS